MVSDDRNDGNGADGSGSLSPEESESGNFERDWNEQDRQDPAFDADGDDGPEDEWGESTPPDEDDLFDRDAVFGQPDSDQHGGPQASGASGGEDSGTGAVATDGIESVGEEPLELADIEEDDSETSTDGSHSSGGSGNGGSQRLDEGGEWGPSSSVSKPTVFGSIARGYRLFKISFSDALVIMFLWIAVAALMAVVAGMAVPLFGDYVYAYMTGSFRDMQAIAKSGHPMERLKLSAINTSFQILGYAVMGTMFPLFRMRFFEGTRADEDKLYSTVLGSVGRVVAFTIALFVALVVGYCMCCLPGLVVAFVSMPALYIEATRGRSMMSSFSQGLDWVKNYFLKILGLNLMTSLMLFPAMIGGWIGGYAIGDNVGAVAGLAGVSVIGGVFVIAIQSAFYASIEAFQRQEHPSPAML